MPGGPLAHICFLVRDLDQAVEDWKTILAELDPAQLEQPIVMVERWEAGEDVMSSATFVNPGGSEIQLLCPLNDGPLGRRLAKHGEHVHHVCFVSPDLPAAVERLAAKGIELTALGRTLTTWQDLEVPEPAASDTEIAGEILRVDRFGNLVTNVSRELFERFAAGAAIDVAVGPHHVEKVVATYAEAAAGEVCALFGSSDHLEVAVNGGSAAERLNLGRGAKLRIARKGS